MPEEKENLRVLPCADSSAQAHRFRGLKDAAGIELLPLALAPVLLARVRHDQPDVIVIAAERLSGSAWSRHSQLGEVLAATPCLLLAAVADPATLRIAERLAIHTVLPWDAKAAQQIAAVFAVHAGLAVSLPSEHDDLGELEGLAEAEFPGHLTSREVEVLRLMALGLGNKQIAARLQVSEHTAKFHVSQVLGKLGASSRTEAVSLGITHGLVAI